MIKIIITMFIFCVILFFYLHIQFHLKTSDDLEIYEIEQASKDKMEEICDLRQPVLFDLPSVEDSDKISNTTNKQYLLDNYNRLKEPIWVSIPEMGYALARPGNGILREISVYSTEMW
jgi:hypothetical protein